MPDVRALRSSLEAFAVEVGRPLRPWQARAFALEARFTTCRAPRQSGKSRSLAVLALWRAFREPGHRCLIVSAGEDASRRLLAEVRSVALASPLLSSSVVDDGASLVTLANGSEVRSVPASERQVRGWTVDTLLVDEAALVSEDLLLGAAIPTTAARPEARVVLASSPLTTAGAFYDFVVRGEAGSEHVRSFRWRLEDCDWITPSTVAAARESMSALRFAAEYEAEWASGGDLLFTRHALDRVTADYALDDLASMTGPARVLAGVDWGAVHDRSTLVAIGRLPGPERRFAVRCSERWPAGYALSGVVDEIVGSPAHFDTIVPETNGLGLPLAQSLELGLRRREVHRGGAVAPAPARLVDLDEWGDLVTSRRPERPALVVPGLAPFRTRIMPTHTTADLKAAGYSALRLLVDRERLLLPTAAEDLRRELLLLRVDLTASGGERIEASTGHDDLADALMLAQVPYRSREDRRWHVYLSDLADERRQLPTPPADLEHLEMTRTPGGREIPRVPVWLSVRGSETSIPVGALRESPRVAHERRRRRIELAVREANRA